MAVQLLLDWFWERDQWQTFPLERDQLVLLGRHLDCHLVIPLPAVSRRHHDLEWDGCRVLLRNRGRSRNGIWLNDRRVYGGIAVLRLGDTLRISAARFRLRVPVQVEPAWVA